MKKFILIFGFCISLVRPSSATHIVGGDITVKWVTANDFEVTLTLFWDCINGSPAAFDPTLPVGIFDLSTNALVNTLNIPFIDSVNLVLGDACYTPPNLCVRKIRYITTVTIPNNPNGYYLSWQRCCRNLIINNIISPNSSGNVFYTEIPDPALQNSTPSFITYPDAYMCVGSPNIDDFSATDINGDSLVYKLTDPLDCSATGWCGTAVPNPGVAPGPYGTVAWQAPYSFTNMMGDPAMAVNSSTGQLSTTPPTLGVFVFTVTVEEYRAGNKIGELRRDVQYEVLTCNGNSPPAFVAPTVLNYTFVAGDSICFPVEVNDPNFDWTWLTATSAVFSGGPNMPIVTWANVLDTDGVAQSTFCMRTACKDIGNYRIDFSGRDSSCYGSTTVPLTVNISVLSPLDGNIDKLIPNVFTPNNDGINDLYKVNATVNKCWDTFAMKIYNRWGQLMFESDDFLFKWDGKNERGKPAPEGVYYFILEAHFKDTEFKKNGYIHLLR